jgi:hypothetical protein
MIIYITGTPICPSCGSPHPLRIADSCGYCEKCPEVRGEMLQIPERAASLREAKDELRSILQELHACAGPAALEKALEPLTLSRHHWHVIDVQPCSWMQINEEMAWFVQMQFANTLQTHWEYVTAAEIFAYRLRVAMARNNEKEMMQLS